jgi:hypothetical protein
MIVRSPILVFARRTALANIVLLFIIGAVAGMLSLPPAGCSGHSSSQQFSAPAIAKQEPVKVTLPPMPTPQPKQSISDGDEGDSQDKGYIKSKKNKKEKKK